MADLMEINVPVVAGGGKDETSASADDVMILNEQPLYHPDLVVPIVYGTVAQVLDGFDPRRHPFLQRMVYPKDNNDDDAIADQNLQENEDEVEHSHAWTVYLRPLVNEDLSTMISRVEFRLHESFKQPVQVCTEMPYQFSTTGWGEFWIGIRIYMRDRTMTNGRYISPDPIFLKLFHYEPVPTTTIVEVNSEGGEEEPLAENLRPHLPPLGMLVINEQYNELVIRAPSEAIRRQRQWAAAHPRKDWLPPFRPWTETQQVQLNLILNAKSTVQEEIAVHRARFEEQMKLVKQLKEERKQATKPEN